MSKYDILDVRELASEWRDARDAYKATFGDKSVIDAPYRSLCADLSVDANPDALEAYGDDYEPTLIHENHFREYAQELAEDVFPYPVGSEAREVLEMWPYRCIDWEAAARELKYDYTSVAFNGETYYIRSV